ncbi:MAG: LptF/LptG family permease [Notoacmeibacter sp.]
MALIELYILRRIGVLAFAALTVTTCIALTTQVLLRIDLLASTGQSLATIGQLALYLVPGMVSIALPFAVMIGILQTMRSMNQDSETVVLEASGTGILQRARPALTIGAIGTAICLAITLWLEPLTSQKIRELLARASGDLLSAAIQSGSFKQIEPGLFIQIAEKRPNGEFGGIFVSDTRDTTNHFTYIAKTGSLLNKDGRTLLIVSDGQIQRRSTKDNTISFIFFDNYSLDAGSFSAPSGFSLRARERSTSYLFSPDINDPEFQRTPERINRELHRRFSDPLYAFLMALIAVYATVTAKSHRQGVGAALALAALAGFGARTFGFVLAGNAGTNLITTGLLYAFPLSLTAVYLWLLLNGRQMKWVDSLGDRAIDVLSTVQAFFSKWKKA